MARFAVIGVNDERDYCECCGRKRLKRVVWIEDTETQEIKHFGTTCATAPIKGFQLDREIKRAIGDFEARQQALWAAVHRLYRSKGGTYSGNGRDGWKAVDRAMLDVCITETQAAQRH